MAKANPPQRNNAVAAYLINSVNEVLKDALSDVAMNKPADPIEYIADWLYAYRGTTRQLRQEQQQEEMRLSLLANRKAALREQKKLRMEFMPKSVKTKKSSGQSHSKRRSRSEPHGSHSEHEQHGSKSDHHGSKSEHHRSRSDHHRSRSEHHRSRSEQNLASHK